MDRDNLHRYFGGQARPGDIAPYVILTGSKERVKRFASFWENSRQVADHYEFLIYSGEYCGHPISCCSTGIGGMSVSIAMEELAFLKANTFLRVGVTSPLVDELEYGELSIARGAVRWDGTSQDYVRPEYPAIAHFEVVMAAICAADHLGYPYKVGIIGDFASLGPDSNEGFRHFLAGSLKQKKEALYKAGVMNGTGESSTMLVQSSIYGFRAGVVHVNSVDKVNQRWDPEADEKVVQMGLETMRILMEWDKLKAAKGLLYITPEYE